MFAQKMLNFVITADFAFNLHRVVFSCNATLNSSFLDRGVFPNFRFLL